VAHWLCARLATNRIMSAAEHIALQTLHRRSLEAVERGDVDLCDALNREFHFAFYRGTHNAFPAEHVACLWQRVAPFRRAHQTGRPMQQSGESTPAGQAADDGFVHDRGLTHALCPQPTWLSTGENSRRSGG
jgi:DNA-binding GntR family transcriptional regulator